MILVRLAALVRTGTVVTPPSSTTWSPTNKAAQALLSNGNLTATGDGTGSDFMGRSDTTISGTNKYYWEISADVVVTTHPVSGICNSTATFASFLGNDANSLGYLANGQVFFNGGLVTTIATFTTGNIIGNAIDFAAGKIWFRVGAGNWNNDIAANQNPVGAVGGITIPAGSMFAAYSLLSAAATTLTPGPTFANAAPTGFTNMP